MDRIRFVAGWFLASAFVLGGLSAQALAGTVDTTTAGTTSALFGGDTQGFGPPEYTQLGGTVTAPAGDTVLTSFTLKIGTDGGSIETSLKARVYACTAAGVPTGAPIFESAAFPEPAVDTVMTFTPGIAITGGSRYWIGVANTGTSNASTYFTLYFRDDNPLAAPLDLYSGLASAAPATPDGLNAFDLFSKVVFNPPVLPTIVSLARVNPTPTNLATVNWTLTFASPVLGVVASNFSLSGTATSGASVGTPTTGNAGLTWNVPVTTGPSDGTLTLSMANATGQSPTTPTTLPFTGETYTIDKTVPTVAVTPASGTFTTSPITFTLTFSEAVTGLTAAGITVTNGTKGALAGGPSIYTIPVSPTAPGTVTCVVNAAAATDAAGNGNTASNTASVTFSPPTVTSLNRVNPTPSNLATVNWLLTLSSASTPVTAGNFTLTGTATGGASVGTPTTGNGGLTWNVPVTTGSSNGTLTLNLANTTGQSPPIFGSLPFVGQTYDMDKSAPTVAVTPASGTFTTAPITFTLTFSEPVSGLTAAGITVTNGTKGALSGGPSIYTIPVTPTAVGAVTCAVPAGSAVDSAGNANTVSNTASVTFAPPTVTSLNRANPTPSNLSIVNWTLVLSSAATPLAASNFSLSGTATAGASVGTPTTGNGGLTWNVPVATGPGSGTLTLNVANTTGVTPPIFGTLPFVGQTYDMDKVAPTVAVTPNGITTGAVPIVFTLTFSEPVTGLTAAAVTVTGGTKGALSGGPTVYTLPVTASGPGTVTCQVPAGTATDLAGNANLASNNASVTFVPAPVVTCSTTVTAMQPTGGGLVNVGLTYTSSDPTATKTVAVYSNDNNLTGTTTSFFFNGGFYYPKPAAAQLFGTNLMLRADRYATPGRVYLIVVKATNAGGTGFACCTVVVPYSAWFLSPPATITTPAAAAKTYCDANAGAPPPGPLPPAGAGYDTQLAPTSIP